MVWKPLDTAVAYKDVRGRAKQDARAVLSRGMTAKKTTSFKRYEFPRLRGDGIKKIGMTEYFAG